MLKSALFSKKIINIAVILLVALVLCGCKKQNILDGKTNPTEMSNPQTESSPSQNQTSSQTSTTKKTTTSTSTKSCTPKKFAQKYTYVYETEEECKKKYETNIIDVMDTVNSEVFAGNYRAIKDDCGKTWYGVYYYTYDNNTNKEVEWYY